MYPWSRFSTISTNSTTSFKRWLFLPADDVQILDKSLLYGKDMAMMYHREDRLLNKMRIVFVVEISVFLRHF